jgi:hypothetical protein
MPGSGRFTPGRDLVNIVEEAAVHECGKCSPQCDYDPRTIQLNLMIMWTFIVPILTDTFFHPLEYSLNSTRGWGTFQESSYQVCTNNEFQCA